MTKLKSFLADERYKEAKEVADARNLLGRCYQFQKKFTEALATWREYLSKHPAHEAWSAVQREIINTEYLMAEEARQEKKYDEARQLYAEFRSQVPARFSRNPQILYLYGEMLYRAGQSGRQRSTSGEDSCRSIPSRTKLPGAS